MTLIPLPLQKFTRPSCFIIDCEDLKPMLGWLQWQNVHVMYRKNRSAWFKIWNGEGSQTDCHLISLSFLRKGKKVGEKWMFPSKSPPKNPFYLFFSLCSSNIYLSLSLSVGSTLCPPPPPKGVLRLNAEYIDGLCYRPYYRTGVEINVPIIFVHISC